MEGRELVRDSGGEGTDCEGLDVAQEVLDSDLLGLFRLD